MSYWAPEQGWQRPCEHWASNHFVASLFFSSGFCSSDDESSDRPPITLKLSTEHHNTHVQGGKTHTHLYHKHWCDVKIQKLSFCTFSRRWQRLVNADSREWRGHALLACWHGDGGVWGGEVCVRGGRGEWLHDPGETHRNDLSVAAFKMNPQNWQTSLKGEKWIMGNILHHSCPSGSVQCENFVFIRTSFVTECLCVRNAQKHRIVSWCCCDVIPVFSLCVSVVRVVSVLAARDLYGFIRGQRPTQLHLLLLQTDRR